MSQERELLEQALWLFPPPEQGFQRLSARRRRRRRNHQILTAALALTLAAAAVTAIVVSFRSVRHPVPTSKVVFPGRGPYLGLEEVTAPDTGWAIGSRPDGQSWILRSPDEGMHWMDVTPPGFSISRFTATSTVSLLYAHDPLDVWVMSESQGHLAVFRTTDAGSTWDRVAIPGSFGAGGSLTGEIDFFGSTRIGVVLVGQGGNGMVFTTADDGLTWSKAGDVPFVGPMLPASETTGWAVGARTGNALYATGDAGATWSCLFDLAGVPTESGCPRATKAPAPVSVRGGAVTVGLPAISTGFPALQRMIVPVTISGSNRVAVAFFITRDGGVTWSYLTSISVKASLPFGQLGAATDLIDVNNWVVAVGSSVEVTHDGGRTWREVKAAGPVVELRFATPDVGWTLVGTGANLKLYATKDGWKTFSPVKEG